MKLWRFSPLTGELVGRGTADPHPIEEGEWLVPAYATTLDPGVALPGNVKQWDGSAWCDVRDCRGETWWKADAEFNTEPVVIDFLGEPQVNGFTKIEPPAPPVPPPAPVVATALQLFTALALSMGRTPAEIEALAEVAKTL